MREELTEQSWGDINNERMKKCKGPEVSGSRAPSGNLKKVALMGVQRVGMKVA